MNQLTFFEKEEIVGKNQLEIFKKRGTKAVVTDFGILTGCINSSYMTKEKAIEDRTGFYFTKTIILEKLGNGYGYNDDIYTIGGDGFEHRTLIYADCGIRPVISFSTISDTITSKVRGKDGILEVEWGEYPQKAAPRNIQKELENMMSSFTGKIYTIYVNKKQKNLKEFEYNGKKYVRVKANFWHHYDKTKTLALPNGLEYMLGDPVWIEVNPIKWIVDEKSNQATSKNILLGGIAIDMRDYKDMKSHITFETSGMKKYLDNHLSKDIIPSQTVKQETQPESKKENKEMIEIMKKAKECAIVIALVEKSKEEDLKKIEQILKKFSPEARVLFHTLWTMKKEEKKKEETTTSSKVYTKNNEKI